MKKLWEKKGTKKTKSKTDQAVEDYTVGVDYFNRIDANHVYFAIKGLNSEFPYPAGSYKLEAGKGEDVSIHFSTPQEMAQFSDFKDKYSLKLEVSDRQFSGLPLKGVLTIKNETGMLLRQGHYKVELQKEGAETVTGEFAGLPPFGEIRLPFTLIGADFWEKFSGDISAEATFLNSSQGEQATQAVSISPLGLMISLISLTLFGAVIGLYTISRRVKGRVLSH